jgi:CDP-glucose 4,6-dehydratase
MGINFEMWKGKKVLVTGHTGFKGSWLSYWLKLLGAEVIGISLPPVISERSLYTDAELNCVINSEYFLNIINESDLHKAITNSMPDYIFHFAAQAFIHKSVNDPRETIKTNIIGTTNVLLSALSTTTIQGITIATTDKVYKNNGKSTPFIETDRLGGSDPYSSSKAASELIIESITKTLNPRLVFVCTGRAGNVIGGGDWGENRLVPDIIRAIEFNKPLIIRNLNATRPWQYILDCLYGYILIAQAHFSKMQIPSSINFGPTRSLPVIELINIFEASLKQKIRFKIEISTFEEADHLELNSNLALDHLGWKNNLSVEKSIKQTVNWYSKYLNGISPQVLIEEEI